MRSNAIGFGIVILGTFALGFLFGRWETTAREHSRAVRVGAGRYVTDRQTGNERFEYIGGGFR